MSEHCQLLPWDSTFFGLKIARVISNQLNSKSMHDVKSWCQENDIDCLYLLADPNHNETIRLAEDGRYSLVDIRTTLFINDVSAIQIPNQDSSAQVRPYQAQDITALRKISRSSFTMSRFYSDPCFPREKCDELYEVWIANSCAGYADAVLVIGPYDAPLGFITCHINPDGLRGDIGLVGVDEIARGRGFGKELVFAALQWFIDQRVGQVFVVTQGANIPAQRLYQRIGFYTHSVQHWYHKWFKSCIGNIANE